MIGPRILVDLDGVVVDLIGEAMDRGYLDHWPCRWNFPGCCTRMLMNDVFAGDIFAAAGPIRGALHGVDALLGLGYDIQFVSTPWPTNHQSAADKYTWVEKWFGTEMVGRLTLTHDKTLIPAAILIDDKPDLVGPWRHVTYPQAWNSREYPTWADGFASVVVAIAGPPA